MLNLLLIFITYSFKIFMLITLLYIRIYLIFCLIDLLLTDFNIKQMSKINFIKLFKKY